MQETFRSSFEDPDGVFHKLVDVDFREIAEDEDAVVEREVEELRSELGQDGESDTKRESFVAKKESVPDMDGFVERKDMSEHSQEPGDSVEFGVESERVEMVEEWRIVESEEMREECQVFLDGGRVVFVEEPFQVLVDEGIEASKSQWFIVEVHNHEWRSERVQSLPVDESSRLVQRQPGLQNTTQFLMSFGRRQQIVVLMTTRNIDTDLSICTSGSHLVYLLVKDQI